MDLLRWFCLGMAVRVITWPMGFIILAKGQQTYFFWTELAWTIVNVGLSWLAVCSFGLNGAGMAFFGSYVFHGLMIYPVVRRLSGFRWSAENRKTALLFVALMGSVFGGFYVLPAIVATAVGALLAILSGAYSTRILLRLLSLERFPRSIQRLLLWSRLAVSDG